MSVSNSELTLDRVLPQLRCPATGEQLVRKSSEILVSTDSGVEWPVVGDVPVFTPEGRSVRVMAAEHLSNPIPVEAARVLHDADGDWALNLSAGGTSRPLRNVIEMEYSIFRHTNVVGDAHTLPFASETFAAVVCLNAFEHYSDPRAVMSEVWRVMQPGGRFFLHTAFLQPMHEEPFHFYNCTRYGLERWLERFDVEEISVSDNFNPLYALSWLAYELEAGFESLSPKEARAFRKLRVGELSDFWRKRENPDERLGRRFSGLPLATQERAAAGWQAIARKHADGT